jgi:hypothetical protein
MNRTSSIPTAPSWRGFLAVLSAGAASAVAPAALAAPFGTRNPASSLLPAAAAASEVDPIFAVIAEHRAHMRDCADAMDAEDEAESDAEDEAATAAIYAASKAFDASIGHVLTVQPTTIAGVAALLKHVGQEEFLGMSSGGVERHHYETVLTTWHNLDRGDPRTRIAKDFPLRLAATVRTMAGTATIRPIEPSEPDPIYAAIKAEREAYAAYLATGEVQSKISDQDPDPDRCPIAVKPGVVPRKRRKTKTVKAWWAEYQKAEAVHEKSCQEFFAARSTFLQTQPSTVAGLRALVDHINGPFSHGDGCEAFWDEHEMEMACPTLTAAVRSLIG